MIAFDVPLGPVDEAAGGVLKVLGLGEGVLGGAIRERPEVDDFGRDGIEAAARDLVRGELIAELAGADGVIAGGGGIVDGDLGTGDRDEIGEIAGAPVG